MLANMQDSVLKFSLNRYHYFYEGINCCSSFIGGNWIYGRNS